MTSVARKALAGILELSKEEAEHQGDYQHAGEVLELAMTQTLTEAELGSEQKLRARLKDLLKLAEMKWRYRVVEKGQSPRDEALKALKAWWKCRLLARATAGRPRLLSG